MKISSEVHDLSPHPSFIWHHGYAHVSTWRPDEELPAYTTPAFLHDKVQWKKIVFTSLGCKVGLGDLSKSGAVRILNCNMNFV